MKTVIRKCSVSFRKFVTGRLIRREIKLMSPFGNVQVTNFREQVNGQRRKKCFQTFSGWIAIFAFAESLSLYSLISIHGGSASHSSRAIWFPAGKLIPESCGSWLINRARVSRASRQPTVDERSEKANGRITANCDRQGGLNCRDDRAPDEARTRVEDDR